MLADAVNGNDDIVCVVALRFAAPSCPRLSREPSNDRLGESLTLSPNPDPDPDPDPDAAWTRHADRRADAAALGCFDAAPSTLGVGRDALPTFTPCPDHVDATMRASEARCSSKILVHKWTQTAHG